MKPGSAPGQKPSFLPLPRKTIYLFRVGLKRLQLAVIEILTQILESQNLHGNHDALELATQE
jgi:hypothetical protein